MKIIYLTFILVLLPLNNSYAFNSDKCSRIASKAPFGIFASTSSYISSTGDCSMLGLVEHDQKLFIAQAYEPLQIDLARGNGEFADAFAEISKCNSLGKAVLMRELQKNFGEIFEENNEDVEKIHSKILNVMKNDQTISTNCTLDS